MPTEPPTFETVLRWAAAADRDVVSMVNGAPDWDPPSAMRDGLREAAAVDAAKFQYAPVRGLEPLREEIAARRNVATDAVIITAGATEANHLLMATALSREAGSEAIFADPYYPYYPRRTRLLGGTPIPVSVDADGTLDPEDVREVVSEETAAIVINTPNNPTGAVYDLDTLQALSRIAESVDAFFLSDETYGHVDLSGSFSSTLEIDSPIRFVSSSVSKSLAVTGIRIGYLIVPPRYREDITDRHELTTISASRPAQYAVMNALQETEPEYYESVRSRLRKRRDTFLDAMNAIGAEYTTPDMGFYVLAKLPGLSGSTDTVKRLITEVGVASMPGEAFGSARAEYLRFALVTPRVETAADRLRSAVDSASTDGQTSDRE